MNKIYAVYGASGQGRESMAVARQMLLQDNIPSDKIYFIDDHLKVDKVNDHKVLSFNDFLELEADEKHVNIAISNSKIRKQIAQKIIDKQIQFFSIISDCAVVLDEVKIGKGAILSPFSVLTSNIRIGNHFQSNIYSSVAHDCIVGDYVTLGPSATVNGNVHIKDNAYIGSGAMIIQGKPSEPIVIGEGAIIGMGAVVLESVPAGATVVGNPAKSI